MVKMIGATSGPVTITVWLGLWTGAISAYSSSSGVVMPAPVRNDRRGSSPS